MERFVRHGEPLPQKVTDDLADVVIAFISDSFAGSFRFVHAISDACGLYGAGVKPWMDFSTLGQAIADAARAAVAETNAATSREREAAARAAAVERERRRQDALGEAIVRMAQGIAATARRELGAAVERIVAALSAAATYQVAPLALLPDPVPPTDTLPDGFTVLPRRVPAELLERAAVPWRRLGNGRLLGRVAPI